MRKARIVALSLAITAIVSAIQVSAQEPVTGPADATRAQTETDGRGGLAEIPGELAVTTTNQIILPSAGQVQVEFVSSDSDCSSDFAFGLQSPEQVLIFENGGGDPVLSAGRVGARHGTCLLSDPL